MASPQEVPVRGRHVSDYAGAGGEKSTMYPHKLGRGREGREARALHSAIPGVVCIVSFTPNPRHSDHHSPADDPVHPRGVPAQTRAAPGGVPHWILTPPTHSPTHHQMCTQL